MEVKEKTYEEIHDELLNQALPKCLEEIESAIKKILRYGGKDKMLVAIELSHAKQFFTTANEWAVWGRSVYNIDDESKDIHHLRQVGDMMLAAMHDTKIYEVLFEMEHTKLDEIAKIYRAQGFGIVGVKNFIKSTNYKEMKRDDIRAAVDEWIGIKKEKKEIPFKVDQPELPGLWKNISDMSENFKNIDRLKIIEGYNPDTAHQTIEVGINCMTIVAEYYKKSGEFKKLSVLELNKLESISNKIYKQFSAWREEVCATDLKPAG